MEEEQQQLQQNSDDELNMLEQELDQRPIEEEDLPTYETSNDQELQQGNENHETSKREEASLRYRSQKMFSEREFFFAGASRKSFFDINIFGRTTGIQSL